MRDRDFILPPAIFYSSCSVRAAANRPGQPPGLMTCQSRIDLRLRRIFFWGGCLPLTSISGGAAYFPSVRDHPAGKKKEENVGNCQLFGTKMAADVQDPLHVHSFIIIMNNHNKDMSCSRII